jgi:UDP-glucose 4-epimerase
VRALVTGGAGFIGSHLVDRLLAEGHTVSVIDDLSSGRLANLAEARRHAAGHLDLITLDISRPETVEAVVRASPGVVFHLAAQADVRVSVARPVFDAQVNLIGTLNVLEGARLAGADKVVFASSGGTIYGEPTDLPVSEDAPMLPLSPYGVAKRAAVDYLRSYRVLHDLEYTALAFANVYGPRQDPHGEAGVVAIFAGLLLDGKPCVVFGDGTQTRDFVFVDDVVDSLCRAVDQGGGLLVNVGTGEETSVNDLYSRMARLAGVPDLEPVRKPARQGELTRIALDNARARAHLGWRPFTPLDEGLQAVLDSVRSAGGR